MASLGYFETLLVIILIARMGSLGYLEIFLAFSCFVYLKGNKKFMKRLLRPWNLPFLGKLPYLLWDVHRIHDEAAYVLERTRGTYHLKGPWFANMDILATVDPANVHYIMSANFGNYPKGPEFKKIFDVLGDGIFNSDEDVWKSQRKQARALINHQRFHKFLVKTSKTKIEQGLIPVLENVAKTGQVVDMQEVFKRLSFDTTCKMVTGYDPGCLTVEFTDVPFSKAMDDVEEAIFMRHVFPNTILKLQKWLGIGFEKKLSKAWGILDDVILDYIAKKRQDLVSNELSNSVSHEEGFDLLTSYIKEDHENNNNQDKFLRDTILNLMIAGRDTTSSALTWFLWLVITNPIVLKQIREELKGIVPPDQEPQKFMFFEAQELRNLPYLHGAFCEALRLYPPVPFEHKEPLKPDILPSGHHVHPKMKVMFSLYAMGRMSFIWGKDSREFKPERWISESGTIRHEPSYKFLAFNAGPRTCLGKEVAFIQMKTVAAAILHNYDIQVVENHPIVPNVSIILYMKHGLKVTVKNRWSST